MSKIMKFDIRMIYWVGLAILFITMMRPMGLPITIKETTKAAYDTIESLPAGSFVVFLNKVIVSAWPENGPGFIALIKHVVKNKLNFIIVSIDVEAPITTTKALEACSSILNTEGYEYGKNYAIFGFIAGQELAIVSLANDVPGTLGSDIYGTTVSEIDVMQNIRTAGDVDLAIQPTSSSLYLSTIRHWVMPFGVKLIVHPGAEGYPESVPYFDSGQIVGSINSVRGGAEYELLSSNPGNAIKSLDATSAIFLFMVLLIVVGNVNEFLAKYRDKTGREK